MDPDRINGVILRIYVDKKILAMPSSSKLVWVQGMGVKNIKY